MQNKIAFTNFLFSLQLAWNFEVQDRLREEIRDLIEKTKGKYSIEDIENCNYLNMVVSGNSISYEYKSNIR